MSTIEALIKDLPKFSTTAASETSSATDSASTGSTTTTYSPTVTPPSAAGNPNIWGADHRADGTVFIAVGSIVAAIVFGMLVWSLVTSHLSRRIAKKSLMRDNYAGHSRGSTGFYDNGDDKEFFAALKSSDDETIVDKTKRSKLGLLKDGSNLRESNSWDSLPEYGPELSNYAAQERLNPIQDSFPRHNRNSLFISPTLEVVHQQSQKSRLDKVYHDRSLSATSLSSGDKNTPLLSSDLHRPERAASPERKEKKTPGTYHKRNKSSLGLNPVDFGGAVKERKPRDGPKRKTPSMYLNDMLQGEDMV